jgi:hypothetical protein
MELAICDLRLVIDGFSIANHQSPIVNEMGNSMGAAHIEADGCIFSVV